MKGQCRYHSNNILPNIAYVHRSKCSVVLALWNDTVICTLLYIHEHNTNLLLHVVWFQNSLKLPQNFRTHTLWVQTKKKNRISWNKPTVYLKTHTAPILPISAKNCILSSQSLLNSFKHFPMLYHNKFIYISVLSNAQF